MSEKTMATIPADRIPRLLELVGRECRNAALENNEREHELWSAIRSELNEAAQELRSNAE